MKIWIYRYINISTYIYLYIYIYMYVDRWCLLPLCMRSVVPNTYCNHTSLHSCEVRKE